MKISPAQILHSHRGYSLVLLLAYCKTLKTSHSYFCAELLSCFRYYVLHFLVSVADIFLLKKAYCLKIFPEFAGDNLLYLVGGLPFVNKLLTVNGLFTV